MDNQMLELSFKIIMFVFLITIVYYIFMSLALYNYFKVTGHSAKAWKAFVPFVLNHQILIMGGMNPLLILVIIFGNIIPIFGTVIVVFLVAMSYYNMYLKFSGSEKALLGTILVFIPLGSFVYHMLVLNKKENIIYVEQENIM